MAYDGDIIYVCHSTNNKNVRKGELDILRKYEDKLYFEFGDNEMNLKKRYYDNLETLNKDFEALSKIKEDSKSLKNEELSVEKKIISNDRDSRDERNFKTDVRTEIDIKKPYRQINKKSLI